MRFDLDLYQFIIRDKTDIVPQNVWEIGSRDGKDAEWLAKTFSVSPKNVFTIEMHPVLHKNIVNAYPDFNNFQVAVGKEQKIITFNTVKNCDADYGMSSILSRGENEIDNYDEIIEVDCWRMDNLLESVEAKSIDLCKLDVEGITLDVLESFGDKIELLKSVHLEAYHHDIWKNSSKFEDIDAFMTKNGFVLSYFFRNILKSSDCIYIKKKHFTKT